MSAAALLITELSKSGIVLEQAGGQIVLDGPASLVTDALIAKVRDLKSDIVTQLNAKSANWDVEDWQALFDERAGIAEFDGGFNRLAAELIAFEDCVSRWQASHPPAVAEPGICIHCGQSTANGDGTNVPVSGHDGQKGVLHAGCASRWQNLRRWDARQALMWLLHGANEIHR